MSVAAEAIGVEGRGLGGGGEAGYLGGGIGQGISYGRRWLLG